MRHFIVLGFGSNSQKDRGKSLYLGTDHSEAIAVVNTQSKKYCRRELFELGQPEMRRHAAPAAQVAPVDADQVDADQVDADQVDADQVDADQVDADQVDADQVDTETPASDVELTTDAD